MTPDLIQACSRIFVLPGSWALKSLSPCPLLRELTQSEKQNRQHWMESVGASIIVQWGANGHPLPDSALALGSVTKCSSLWLLPSHTLAHVPAARLGGCPAEGIWTVVGAHKKPSLWMGTFTNCPGCSVIPAMGRGRMVVGLVLIPYREGQQPAAHPEPATSFLP